MRLQGTGNLPIPISWSSQQHNRIQAASLGAQPSNPPYAQQLQQQHRTSISLVSHHDPSGFNDSTANAQQNIFQPSSFPRNTPEGVNSNDLIRSASQAELRAASFGGAIQDIPTLFTQQIEQHWHQKREQQQQQHAFYTQNSQCNGSIDNSTSNTYKNAQSTSSSAPPQPIPSRVQVPYTTQLLHQQQSEALGLTTSNGMHNNQRYNQYNHEQNQQQQELTSLNQFHNSDTTATSAVFTSASQNTAYNRQTFDSQQQVLFPEASPLSEYPHPGSAAASAYSISTAPDMTSSFQDYHDRQTSSGFSFDSRSQDNMDTEEDGNNSPFANGVSNALQLHQQPHGDTTSTLDTPAGSEHHIFSMEEVFEHDFATDGIPTITATSVAAATSSSNGLCQPSMSFSVHPINRKHATLQAIRNISSVSCPAAHISSSPKDDSIITSNSIALKQQQRSYAPSPPLPLPVHSRGPTAIAGSRNTSSRVPCTMCDKTFTRERDMTRHLKSIHYGDKYQCFICQKPFTRKDSLTRHFIGQRAGSEVVPANRSGCYESYVENYCRLSSNMPGSSSPSPSPSSSTETT